MRKDFLCTHAQSKKIPVYFDTIGAPYFLATPYLYTSVGWLCDLKMTPLPKWYLDLKEERIYFCSCKNGKKVLSRRQGMQYISQSYHSRKDSGECM